MTTPSKIALRIPRRPLKDALDQLARLTRGSPSAEAILSFDGDRLIINVEGGGVDIPAVGTWPGQARIPGSILLRLRRALPSEDPLDLSVVDGTIAFSTTRFPCHWDERNGELIPVSARPDLGELYRISLAYSEEEIEQSGLTSLTKAACEKGDRLLEVASDALQGLGIKSERLRDFVLAELRGRF